MRAKSPLVLGAVVLVLVAAGLWLNRGPAEPEPAAPDVSAGPELAEPVAAPKVAPLPVAKADAGPAPATAVAPADPDSPTDPSFDPFQGQMDDVLAEAHMKVLDGERLSLPMLRKLVAHRKEHPDDARANMLLAYDSMNHMRHGEGVRLYRMAYKNDPGIAKDPRVLRDLVYVVSEYSRTELREASEVIGTIYGDKAVGEIDRRIEWAQRKHKSRSVERLQALREHLLSGK